jgi:hypothetical protein
MKLKCLSCNDIEPKEKALGRLLPVANEDYLRAMSKAGILKLWCCRCNKISRFEVIE